MQEESQPDPLRPLPQQAAERDQVVVVHPDQVARTQQGGQSVGELLVHRHVGFEILPAELGQAGPPVQQRPQRAVGEPLIVATEQRGRDIHRGMRQPARMGDLRRCRRRPRLVRPDQPNHSVSCAATASFSATASPPAGWFRSRGEARGWKRSQAGTTPLLSIARFTRHRVRAGTPSGTTMAWSRSTMLQRSNAGGEVRCAIAECAASATEEQIASSQAHRNMRPAAIGDLWHPRRAIAGGFDAVLAPTRALWSIGAKAALHIGDASVEHRSGVVS